VYLLINIPNYINIPKLATVFKKMIKPKSINMNIPKLPTGHSKDELIKPRERLSEATLKSMLRDMNLKVTHQRLSILKTLNEGPKTHFTAKEVFEHVQLKHPNIGFATVYRFLKETARFNITSELRIGHAPTRYELKTKEHHHHIICTRCKKIIEFQNDIIEKQIEKLSKDHDFSMEHHIFEIYGHCNKDNCR